MPSNEQVSDFEIARRKVEIQRAKTRLDIERLRGDQLKIDLAESTLNNLLEQYGGSPDEHP